MSEPLLKQHFGKFGVVSGMNSRPDGSAVVTFAARWLAEKALQNAGQLEDGSTLQLDWWTGPAVAINGTEMEQQASNEMEVTMDV
jgi:hypothetical protein